MNIKEKPPIIRITLSALFGIIPGVAFMLSVWISLALVTLILRALHIFY